jgi:uncharacterized protein YxeA
LKKNTEEKLALLVGCPGDYEKKTKKKRAKMMFEQPSRRQQYLKSGIEMHANIAT